MAQPIQFDHKKQNSREALREQLDQAPLEHADAVLALYKLLSQAQDHGVLDAVRGAIVAGDAITAKLAEYANTPEAIRAIRNLISLGLLVGQLDPETLQSLTKGVEQSTSAKNPDMRKPPSMFAILRRLFSEDARRGMAAGVSILSNVGRTLRPKDGRG